MIISQYGNLLSEDKFSIDLDNKVFRSIEDNLVLDFKGLYDWAFITGDDCMFITASNCTFDTGSNCTFDTTYNCKFITGDDCTFDTGFDCNFKAGSSCIFKIDWSCSFDTGDSCTFSLWGINTCKFKYSDDISSTILDREDNKHYLLTKEFVDMLKVING